MSSLSNTLKRTSEVLKVGALSQVSDYEQRFSSLKNLYDDLLLNLVISDFSFRDAHSTVNEFFGDSVVRFAGIDGTMYSRPLFDMVIFFGGAYASTGTIRFQEKDVPQVSYDAQTFRQAAGISSVVPIYVNEIPEVDQAFFESETAGELNPNRPLTDQSIMNNATIANWLMTFSEYYLAYKLAVDPAQKIRILLLDRSLSIERASLIYDTAKRDLWKKRSSLLGFSVDGDEPLNVNDLSLARQCICNEQIGLPPPRGDYLIHAIVRLIQREHVLDEKQIISRFCGANEKRAKRIGRYLKRAVGEKILVERNGAYSLNPKYESLPERMKKIVVFLGDRFFFNELLGNMSSSVMRVSKNGKEQWLTTVDIAFLTLFTLHMLVEECWRRHVLLIGVTKDTAARDFKRQLVPIMHSNGLLSPSVSRVDFEKLPNTDRMILQSTSIMTTGRMKIPWSLIEYDSAFRTMVPDRENRIGFVSGAIRNRVGLEKVFVKTYVQLSQASKDAMLRSNVLLMDRLVYPEYDCQPSSLAQFQTEFGGAQEPLEVVLFKDKHVSNRMQNLVMVMLRSMAPSSIPEAFGHNKPLFIADKIAKWNHGQFRRVVDTTADWMLNNHRLRRFIFYMSTFRERRASIEAARRERV